MVARKTPKYAGSAGAGTTVQQINVNSINGGLNLGRSPIQLASNDSPAALNVDFPGHGGVARRKAVTDSSLRIEGEFTGLVPYERSTSGVQVLYGKKSGVNTVLYESTLTTPKDTFQASYIQGATLDDKLYLACGLDTPARRWDGVSSTALAATFADDPQALPHGAMPRCKAVAVHKGSLFCGNLVGDASGLRWSWPNEPEDFASWAYESIDQGARHDEIVALVPHHERLLIFKRNSIHALHGYGPDNWSLVTLAQNIGASGPEAVCRTETDVFFYDHPNGVFKIGITGGPERTSFDRIYPALVDAPSVDPSSVVVRWANRKLWVSLPWEGAAKNTRTFVMDAISGAWSAYDYGIAFMAQIIPDHAKDYALGIVNHPSQVQARLGLLDQDGDLDFGTYPILGSWQSAWFAADDLMLDKRWKSVGLVLDGSVAVQVGARLNYSSVNSAVVNIPAPTVPTSSVWGVGVWGTMVWTADTTSDIARAEKARTTGVGKAISFVVSNLAAGDWHVSALQIKFIPKRRRN